MTPLQTWTSTVAFWSTVAQAPSRVAQAQTAATLRMIRAANPWRSARRVAPVEVAAAVAPAIEAPVPIPAVVPATTEVASPEAAEPAVTDIAPPEAAEPEPVEAAPAEVVPHEALTHASPAAIAAATAELVEELPAEAPAPAPVAAEEPALAVLADPGAPASSLPPLDLSPEPILVDADESALAKAAASAVRSTRSRAHAGNSRSRKPGRG